MSHIFCCPNQASTITHRFNCISSENWYRRPIGDEYTIPGFTLEAVELQLAVPERVAIGGNTGTVNSFTPVNLADLTGGVYNSQNLLQGNNLICFGYQTLLTVVPDVLKGLVGDVTSTLNVLTSRVAPSFAQLNCPQLECKSKRVCCAHRLELIHRLMISTSLQQGPVQQVPRRWSRPLSGFASLNCTYPVSGIRPSCIAHRRSYPLYTEPKNIPESNRSRIRMYRNCTLIVD